MASVYAHKLRNRYVFFFQAEDGIRDRTVTGVQTCALPIYLPDANGGAPGRFDAVAHVDPQRGTVGSAAVRVGEVLIDNCYAVDGDARFPFLEDRKSVV